LAIDAGFITSLQLQDHCTVARYGGEEFALIFGNHRLEDVLDLIEIAGCKIAESQTSFEGMNFRFTCSISSKNFGFFSSITRREKCRERFYTVFYVFLCASLSRKSALT